MHGLSRTRAYNSHHLMMQRCYDPKSNSYNRYGGKGVLVAPEWHDFEVFFADMGECPKGMTLDRENNNEGYSKDNCRWATDQEQARNRSNNHVVTVDGVSKPIVAWAEVSGITQYAIKKRLDLGWTPKQAVFTPKYGKYGASK